jgi:peptidoglycan/xylan/chitin deacetylase (PgdA/CDA1 family)
MKKLSEKFVRKHIVNFVLVIMLVSLFSLTILTQTVGAFGSNTYAPFYHGNKGNNNVSIMINVYQGTEYLQTILETLKQYNAKVTFFVGGCWAIKNSDIIQKMIDDGHEIGNHGYFHKDHKKLSKIDNKKEMELTHNVIQQVFDYTIKLFAPPSGSFGQNTLDAAKEMDYQTIMWTKDTIDWRDSNENVLYTRATKNPSSGDLILMHPTLATSNILSKVISFYQKEGYNLTTVYQNIL